MMFRKQNKVGNVLMILFLLLALGVSSWLVKKTQELSRRAAGDNAKLILDPVAVSGKIGDYKTIKVIADTSFNNRKVDFAEVNLCYGPQVEIEDMTKDVKVVDTAAFDKDFVKKSIYDSKDVAGEKCLVLAATNGDKPVAETKSGVLIMASINFKLVKNGETKIVVRAEDKNKVALYGESKDIEITTKEGTNVKVSEEIKDDNAEILVEGRAMSADKKSLTVSLVVDTKERKPDYVLATVCSNDVLEVSSESNNITIPLSSPFTNIVKSEIEKSVSGPDVCWKIQVKQEKTGAEILSGKQTVVEIVYKVKKTGDYKIYFDKSPSLTAITGVPVGDKKYKIDIVKYGELNGNIAPEATPVPVGGNILKFNILIRGTREKDEENICAFTWNPVKVTVIDANGLEKTVDGVLKKTTDKKEVELPATGFTPVWQVEANLGDFKSNENLLVLIKIPKHLQAAFGQDKYVGRWVKKVGTIGGLKNDSTTPVFDFTGFLIQAGEVVSENGYEEGWLNVRDFSAIKDGVIGGGRDAVACPSDVNGDGVMNAVDSSLFLGELAQKYGEKR